MADISEKQKVQEQLYLDYKEKITRYISGRIADTHTVEDMVSSVFLKVFAGLPSFDAEKASVSTWIYTITRNTLTDYFRTAKQYCELTEMPAAHAGIEEQLISEEMLESLADALTQLEKRERELIILHYYSGYTLRMIAGMMNISYSYVKLLHAKALKALRGMLEE